MATDPLFAIFSPPGAARLRDWLGLGADATAELATTGWCKVVVLVDDIAVLVPRHEELVPALRREVQVLAALHGVGLPGAPELLEVIDDPGICPYPLAVVERVRGSGLEEIGPTLSRSGWFALLRGVGHAVSLVHDHATRAHLNRPPAEHRLVLHGLLDLDLGRRVETLRLAADAVGAGRSRVRALSERLAPATRIAPVVVHNDLHEGQVMVDGEGVTGIVDWQAASVDHPFVDFDVLQWGRGALARLDSGTADHRWAMWAGADGDRRHGAGAGALLDIAWTLNDGWWAATHNAAPVTDFALDPKLRSDLIDRACRLLDGTTVPIVDLEAEPQETDFSFHTGSSGLGMGNTASAKPSCS